ncbi:hypothetical protein Leryth_018785 [Lithospermum erythrorhizon]|nr:hypothetical protein Leryth_018785 [Lithospermum erythrorhizon]
MGSDLNLPPGFRFHPTDEELVMHYLVRKCASQNIDVPIIAEIDLYKYNPWELPDMALYGEKEWYFFSPRTGNTQGLRLVWKATGADKPIGQPKAVGIKKALVFYSGKAPKGEKTNWIMHEYRLAGVDRSARKHKNNLRLDDWVLCRIYNKKGTIEKNRSTIKLSPIQEEEKKPDVNMASLQMPTMHHHQQEEQDVFNSDLMHFDTSESIPKLHTDSSSSDHAVSPEFTSEVQSQPKLFGEEFDKNGFYYPFNYMDGAAISSAPQGAAVGGGQLGNGGFFMNDQFEGDDYQVLPLQDMFMGMLPY